MKALAVVTLLALAACGGAPEANRIAIGDELPASYAGQLCSSITDGFTVSGIGDQNATLRCQHDSLGRYYWLVESADVVGN